MIPALIAIGIGALILMDLWDAVVDWLRTFTREVTNIFNSVRKIAHATRVLAEKIQNAGLFSVIHRIFYKENGDYWQEDTIAQVAEREVPQWAKAGVTSSETDVTQRYQRELQLTL